MDTLKEIASSIADWFKHRVVNPFFAAFIFSWLTINWRLVLCLTSDIPFDKKIAWVDTKMYPKFDAGLWYCLGQPLLWAGAYIFIGPHVFRYVMSYYRRQQNKTRERLLLDDSVELMPLEEGLRIKKERIDALVSLHNERKLATAREQDLIADIDGLRKQLAISTTVPGFEESSKDRKVKGQEVDLSDVELRGGSESRRTALRERGLTKDELQVVIFLAQQGRAQEVDEIANRTKLSRIMLSAMLFRLNDLGVVQPIAAAYDLSPLGQQIASHFLQP